MNSIIKIDSENTGDIDLYARWIEIGLGSNKSVGFYGDSITTFNVVILENADFYYPTYSSIVKKADLTWWRKFMLQIGTKLKSNVSYRGSTVLGTSSTFRINDQKIAEISGYDGSSTDIIIIYLGINDVASGSDVISFKDGYQQMLNKIKVVYPNADVFLCNLTHETWTNGTNPDGKKYPGLREIYNSVIADLAMANQLILIDFASEITSTTESMTNRTYLGDNIHPNDLKMGILQLRPLKL